MTVVDKFSRLRKILARHNIHYQPNMGRQKEKAFVITTKSKLNLETTGILLMLMVYYAVPVIPNHRSFRGYINFQDTWCRLAPFAEPEKYL